MKFPLVANCRLVPTSKLVNSSLVLARTEFLEALKEGSQSSQWSDCQCERLSLQGVQKAPLISPSGEPGTDHGHSPAPIQHWQCHRHGYKTGFGYRTRHHFQSFLQEDWDSGVNKRRVWVWWTSSSDGETTLPLPLFPWCFPPVTLLEQNAQTQTTTKWLTTGYSGCKDGKLFSCKIFPL